MKANKKKIFIFFNSQSTLKKHQDKQSRKNFDN